MAAAASVILAVSPNGILIGLAVVSTGLLALSLSAVIVGLRRDESMRRAARKTYEQVSSSVSNAIEPHQTMASLLAGIEEMLFAFRASLASEEGRGSLSGWDDFMRRARELTSRLRSAHVAVLYLSIDELGFLSSREEFELAALVGYFQAASQFEREIANARRGQ